LSDFNNSTAVLATWHHRCRKNPEMIRFRIEHATPLTYVEQKKKLLVKVVKTFFAFREWFGLTDGFHPGHNYRRNNSWLIRKFKADDSRLIAEERTQRRFGKRI
jgi:hypothetical protein